MSSRSTSIPNPAGGFTLVETVVATTIIVLLLGAGLWVSMDVYRGYSFLAGKNILISALEKARLEAMVNLNESPHGIRIEPDKYVIFQGSTYGENPSLDVAVFISKAVEISGNPALPRDVVFDQLSGDTAIPGTITISNGVRSAEISINSEGGISW